MGAVKAPAPGSRAEQAAKASLVLTRLLRTPKTRNGLVAAVTSKMISRRFVFGWLAAQVRKGNVITFRAGNIITYQIKGVVIVEATRSSEFPSWLEPRGLPVVSERAVFIDGKEVKNFNPISIRERRKGKR